MGLGLIIAILTSQGEAVNKTGIGNASEHASTKVALFMCCLPCHAVGAPTPAPINLLLRVILILTSTSPNTFKSLADHHAGLCSLPQPALWPVPPSVGRGPHARGRCRRCQAVWERQCWQRSWSCLAPRTGWPHQHGGLDPLCRHHCRPPLQGVRLCCPAGLCCRALPCPSAVSCSNPPSGTAAMHTPTVFCAASPLCVAAKPAVVPHSNPASGIAAKRLFVWLRSTSAVSCSKPSSVMAPSHQCFTSNLLLKDSSGACA